MSPQQRTEINRQNASHSTGPVTPAGKATSAGNSTKHGLSGKSSAVLRGEEEAFAKHLAGYREAYDPKTTPEEDLVRTLAENFWRLKRAHAMEAAAFEAMIAELEADNPDAHPSAIHAAAYNDAQRGLQRICTYAARIQRAIEKTTAQLNALQSERKAAYAKAEEEAILLSMLANDHKKISEAAAYFSDGAAANHGGFVYSFEEIRKKAVRQGRLAEARARFAMSSEAA
jgi:hypothetical protein